MDRPPKWPGFLGAGIVWRRTTTIPTTEDMREKREAEREHNRWEAEERRERLRIEVEERREERRVREYQRPVMASYRVRDQFSTEHDEVCDSEALRQTEKETDCGTSQLQVPHCSIQSVTKESSSIHRQAESSSAQELSASMTAPTSVPLTAGLSDTSPAVANPTPATVSTSASTPVQTASLSAGDPLF